MSQSFPLQPAGHRHSPVTWLHEAPRAHRHLASQPAPNRPGSHAEHGRGCFQMTENAQCCGSCVSCDVSVNVCVCVCVGSPLSQRSPIQPALQLQRPVCLSHWPPFSQSHCCWQSAPNWPTSHSAKQEQDRRCEGTSGAVRTSASRNIQRKTTLL